jgi:hypothetical protein
MALPARFANTPYLHRFSPREKHRCAGSSQLPFRSSRVVVEQDDHRSGPADHVRQVHQLLLWIEQPNLGAALPHKDGVGCKVRFLVGDPDGEATGQRERIEATHC